MNFRELNFQGKIAKMFSKMFRAFLTNDKPFPPNFCSLHFRKLNIFQKYLFQFAINFAMFKLYPKFE